MDSKPELPTQAEKLFENKATQKWRNKQRTLVVSSRGQTVRHRHIMLDIIGLMPHSKKESKLEKKDIASQIQDLCIVNTCQNLIYFETRKNKDLYLWLGKGQEGPTTKFHLENVHTSQELQLTGNCLRGSRPVISFDSNFDSQPHWKLIKEQLIGVFNVPQYHPKSQPFIDHVFAFMINDNRIWFRNYQIHRAPENKNTEKFELYEIGPRFVMNPMVILNGCLTGEVLYSNENYISARKVAAEGKRKQAIQEFRKLKKKQKRYNLLKNLPEAMDQMEGIFDDMSFEEDNE